MDFEVGNPSILEKLQPFVVATPWNRPHFDVIPFGLRILDHNIINPLNLESEQFLLLLQEMDRLTFGPEGMPMPRWVFYNCSELPGGIVGFGCPADALSEEDRKKLSVPDDYTGLVPFSMFIAIPMLPAGDWMGHNLCSLNSVLPKAGLKSLASLTKSFGLCVFRTRRLYGATQWRSLALHIHAKFGPLDLVTAYTPAHSDRMTLTYRVEITLNGLLNACGDPTAEVRRPEAQLWVDADDVEQVSALQDEIEQGARFVIPDRPRHEGEKVFVPIVRLPAS